MFADKAASAAMVEVLLHTIGIDGGTTMQTAIVIAWAFINLIGDEVPVEVYALTAPCTPLDLWLLNLVHPFVKAHSSRRF